MDCAALLVTSDAHDSSKCENERLSWRASGAYAQVPGPQNTKKYDQSISQVLHCPDDGFGTLVTNIKGL